MRRDGRQPVVAAAVVVLIAMLAAPRVARAQSAVSVGLNVRVLSGAFGSQQTTHVVYAPAVIRIDMHRFEVSASIPYLTIENGTVALSQAGFVPMQGSLVSAPTSGMLGHSGGMMGQTGVAGVPSAGGLMARESGIGDVVTSAGYRVVDAPRSNVQFVIGARVKLPTASAERGLGTGKTDIAGVITLRKRFGTGWVYAEGGYVAIGQPAGANLNNVAIWSAGTGKRLTDRLYLLGFAAGSSAVISAFGSPGEIAVGVGVKVTNRLILTILPGVGLSNASPKYAVTIGISSDVLRR